MGDAVKFRQITKKELFHDCLQIIFVTGTIGIALKFVTLFNAGVYFPSYPNELDSAFLISAVVYLTWAARRRRYSKNSN
jgi:hypothetical protein